MLVCAVTDNLDYVFSENGVIGFKGRVQYPPLSIAQKIGEQRIQKVINFALKYISELELPAKR